MSVPASTLSHFLWREIKYPAYFPIFPMQFFFFAALWIFLNTFTLFIFLKVLKVVCLEHWVNMGISSEIKWTVIKLYILYLHFPWIKSIGLPCTVFAVTLPKKNKQKQAALSCRLWRAELNTFAADSAGPLLLGYDADQGPVHILPSLSSLTFW